MSKGDGRWPSDTGRVGKSLVGKKLACTGRPIVVRRTILSGWPRAPSPFFVCRALFSSLSVLFSSKSIFLFFIYFFRRTRIPEYSFSAFLFISLIKHIFQKKNTFLTKHSRNCPTCIRPRASYGSVQHIIKLFLASSSNVSQV